MGKARWSRLILSQSDGEEEPDHPGGLLVAPEKPALKKPSMYNVVMHNDDYTPMAFVVHVLMQFFAMPEPKATQVMLAVHHQGRAVCGCYTRDVAETKAAQVNQYAAHNEHPLLCEIERAE